MNQFSMCNMIDELENQVNLDNDPRWMAMDDNISLLPVMLDVTHGSWVLFIHSKLIRCP